MADGEAAAAGRRGRQQRGAATEGAADGAAPMEADEPISDAEEEAAAPAANTVEAIKQAVQEAGQVRPGR